MEETKLSEEQVAKLAKFALLNICKYCGKKAGKYKDEQTGALVGVYLLNAVGAGKICNVCVQFGKGERVFKEKGKHKYGRQ